MTLETNILSYTLWNLEIELVIICYHYTSHVHTFVFIMLKRLPCYTHRDIELSNCGDREVSGGLFR